ncbi:vacuolar fusion protein CCZ1 homolog B-like [Rutidosis leptorrhynchoides]|uniref:vacuolar fusion protein CCZ1 homolog B-like n=1 Tax=Rutidosis leptorrhynchoides TaxID=125765 RepID=UPI003A9A2531
MGLSSTASTANLSDTLKICIFDLRRGQHEGEELEKILFFFPADLPFPAQLSVIGLSEGLITFTRIFSPDAACEVIEADMHSHVFFEAEPDIWMVMVVAKSKETEAIWRIEALRSVLKEIHTLFVMFHGSIRMLLDKEPGGGLVRSHLYTFIMDYLSDFLVGPKCMLPNFRDSLKERGTVQMLTVGREAAIEVQSLVGALDLCMGNTLGYSVILFQDLLVSTTLTPDDTVNLFSYGILRLTPRVLSSSGGSTWSYLRKGNASLQDESAFDRLHGLQDASSTVRGDNYRVVRPLQQGKWSKGKDGFLVNDIWGVEVGNLVPTTPTIWLQQTEHKMYLCAYQHKNLTIILLIPVTSVLNGEEGISMLKQQLLENAYAKIFKVEEKLTKGWGGVNAYHVKGYRYLLVDGDREISRASPSGKVTTLTKESLLALNKVREDVDLEKSRAKEDDVDNKMDLEICIRAKNNAWVIARATRGKELYIVLEKANETLLYASEAVEKFSDRYCNGAFSLD